MIAGISLETSLSLPTLCIAGFENAALHFFCFGSLESFWLIPFELVAIVACAGIVIEVVRGRRDRGARRWIGFSARCVLLGLLVFMLGGWRVQPPVPLSQVVAVAIDTSPSMGTVDSISNQPSPGPSRFDAVCEMLVPPQSDKGWERLLQACEIHLFSIAQSVTPHSQFSLKDFPPPFKTLLPSPLSESMDASRLGDSIDSILHDFGSLPVAVVVASDGAISSGDSWTRTAGRMEALGVPLVVIPVGTSQHDTPHIRFTGAVVPAVVSKGEETVAVIRAAVRGKHLERLPFSFSLTDSSLVAASESTEQTGTMMPLDTGEGVVQSDSWQSYEGTFSFTPTQIGPCGLEVRVEENFLRQIHSASPAPWPLETIVIDEPLSILIADQSPRWEYRFLEQIFSDDSLFRLTMFLPHSAIDNSVVKRIGSLPQTIDEWKQYDVAVLGPIDPTLVEASVADSMRRCVFDDGMGLAWIVTPAHDPVAFRNSGFESIMPLSIPLQANPSPAITSGPWQLNLSAAGRTMGWMNLTHEPIESETQWNSMPELFVVSNQWPLRSLSRVVLTATNASGVTVPAVALTQSGRGMILTHLTGETWRLRAQGISQYWRQAVMMLAHNRIQQQRLPVEIIVGSRQPAPLEELTIDVIETRASDLLQTSLDLQNIDASGSLEVTLPNGTTRIIERDATSRSLLQHRFRFSLSQPGRHRVRFLKDAHTELPSHALSRFVDLIVVPKVPEHAGQPAERAAMERAAVATGGAVVPLESISTLPSILQKFLDRPQFIHGDNARIERAHSRTSWPLWNSVQVVLAVAMAGGFQWWLDRRSSYQ